jgi:hypothetical protein
VSDTRIVSGGSDTHTHGRISFAAIFGGVILVIAVQLLLSLLGAGIGLGTVNTNLGSTPTACTRRSVVGHQQLRGVQTAKDAADASAAAASKTSFAAFGNLLLGALFAAIGGSLAVQWRVSTRVTA